MSNFWVVQEGLLGDITNKFSTTKAVGLNVTWHVVQQATKPNSTAKGPYTTQAQAQSQADSLNAGSQNVVTQAASQDVFHGLNLSTWILRIGEILLGVVLIGVGVAKLTGAENVVSKAAKVAAL